MQAITAEELQDMMSRQNDNDVLVINVCDPEEFLEQHIPGSVNIPLDDEVGFSAQVSKVAGSKDRMVVVYGTSRESDDSFDAARELEDAGFLDIYDFEGGIQEWEDSAGRVQKAA